jgi:hypothetical protein
VKTSLEGVDLQIFDRNPCLGGTWYLNNYPGWDGCPLFEHPGFLAPIANPEPDVHATCHLTRTSLAGHQTPCGPRYTLQRVKSTSIWKMWWTNIIFDAS